MLKNNFSRKCLSLLFALAIVSTTAEIAQGAEKDKEIREKTYAITEAQLQSHVKIVISRIHLSIRCGWFILVIAWNRMGLEAHSSE